MVFLLSNIYRYCLLSYGSGIRSQSFHVSCLLTHYYTCAGTLQNTRLWWRLASWVTPWSTLHKHIWGMSLARLIYTINLLFNIFVMLNRLFLHPIVDMTLKQAFRTPTRIAWQQWGCTSGCDHKLTREITTLVQVRPRTTTQPGGRESWRGWAQKNSLHFQHQTTIVGAWITNWSDTMWIRQANIVGPFIFCLW